MEEFNDEIHTLFQRSSRPFHLVVDELLQWIEGHE